MDYSSDSIRQFNRRRLADLKNMMKSKAGSEEVGNGARAMIHRGASRCKLIRHFGIIAAKEPDELRLLKHVYILAGERELWETSNHNDFLDDPNSFFIAATWMRLSDLCAAINEPAVVAASVRIFPRFAIWPHALMEIALRLEDNLLLVYTQREGLDAPNPEGVDMSTLIGVAIILAAILALKHDLSRCSPEYVRWESLVLAYNADATTHEGIDEAFHRIPILVDMLGFTDVLSPSHYEITRQYRVAYEHLTSNTDRLKGNCAALHKLVSSLRGDAATERAEDGSLTWTLRAEHIQKYMGKFFTDTCRQRHAFVLEERLPA